MKPLTACRWLQNKAWICDPPDRDREHDAYLTPFWCLKTHDSVGPDGGSVGEHCCGRDRPCHQPEVEL